MPLQLHHTYTLDQALSELGDAPREMLCDGQFVALPESVLVFMTIGSTPEQPYVLTPSSLIWKPVRLDYEPMDLYPWLPAKARSKGAWKHQLFVRAAADSAYFFAGKAHLGSYGSDSINGITARFSLETPLPRQLWLQLGGYTGWAVEANHTVHYLAPEDTAGFARLAVESLAHQYAHIILTRYEEDCFHLFTNSERGWLMYLRQPDDSGLYARDSAFLPDPQQIEEFRCVCGIDLEFPIRQTLPLKEALAVIQDYFATGSLPHQVQWETA